MNPENKNLGSSWCLEEIFLLGKKYMGVDRYSKRSRGGFPPGRWQRSNHSNDRQRSGNRARHIKKIYLQFLIAFGAVSYTHLDVYKRQTSRCTLRACSVFTAAISSRTNPQIFCKLFCSLQRALLAFGVHYVDVLRPLLLCRRRHFTLYA